MARSRFTLPHVSRPLSAALATLLATAPALAPAVQITSTWTGGVDSWNDPLSWNPLEVPDNDVASTYVVVIDSDGGTASAVSLDISVTIDAITVDLSDSLGINAGRSLEIVNHGAGTGTIFNAGSLSVNSTGTSTALRIDGDVTLSGAGTVTLNHAVAQIRGVAASDRLTNVDNTIQGRGQIGANTMALTNQGTIDANVAGQTLTLDPSASGAINQGTVQASDGGTLRLQAGDYANAGGLIQALAGSVVELTSGATVQGGTLDSAGDGTIEANANSTLDGVINQGQVSQASGQGVTVENGLVNHGTWNMGSTGTTTTLTFDGTQTLSGSGSVQMSDNLQNRIVTGAGDTLTHAADHTIQGAGQLLANTGDMVNHGTIIADQSTRLEIDPLGTFTNNNVLRAQGSGGLTFNPGLFVNNATIDVADGSKLTLASGATVQGGVLDTAGTGVVLPESGSALDGVTNQGQVSQASGQGVTVENGLLNHGTWTMGSTGTTTTLTFDGTQTLSGSGSVQMSDNLQNRIVTGAGETLTHAADHTIQGAGQLLVDTGDMVNHGTIIADQSTRLQIDPLGTFTNNNVLRAQGSGGLTFNPGLFVNNATIDVADGSKLTLASGATVQGGVLDTAGTGVVLPESGSALDGVTNQGQVSQASGQGVTVENGLLNHGTWTMGSTGTTTTLTFDGTQTLSGSGSVQMSDNLQNRIVTGAGDTLTHAADHTIQGAGQLLVDTGDMVNDGTIIADQSTRLEIDPLGTFTNNNVLRAQGSGGLTFNPGLFVNNATIDVADGSKLTLASGATVQGGVLDTAGTGVVLARSGSALDGVTNQGQVSQASGQGVTVENGLVNHGTWTMGSTGTITALTFDGSQTLSGSGSLQMSDNLQNRIVTGSGGTLTQATGHTIQGSGQILGDLRNQGLVHANQSAGITLSTTAKVNDGIMKASNGATLTVATQITGSGQWVADGGRIRLDSGTSVTGGDISVVHGGELALTNASMSGTSLAMDATGILDVASTLTLSGHLDFAMTDEAAFAWAADSTLAMTGGAGAGIGQWESWARLEVGGSDLGTDPANHVGDPAGFANNFSLSELVIGVDAHVYLADLLDNGNRGGGFGTAEALYVDSLVFGDSQGLLNLNGLNLYYKTLVGNMDQIIDQAVPAVPIPPALWLLGGALGGLLGFRRRVGSPG